MSTFSQLLDDLVSIYLYDTEGRPYNLVSDDFIRNSSATSTYLMDVNAYMAGPGRFARASMSSLVDQFCRPQAYSTVGTALPELDPGIYSKDDLRLIFNNNNFGIRFQQYSYQDDVDDIAERTFLWNSTSIKLNDDVKFVVQADGTRFIDNFSLVPNGIENFDFLSANWLAQITANYLQDRMDLSRIGRVVNIEFAGDPPKKTYTSADFYNDRHLESQQYNDLPPLTLKDQIDEILDGLWRGNITQFLTEDERPILWGTTGSDFLSENRISSNPYFAGYGGTGVAFIAGKGNDTIENTTGQDLIIGGDDVDTVIYSKFEGKNVQLSFDKYSYKGAPVMAALFSDSDIDTIDTLIEIEKINFGSGIDTIRVNGHVENLYNTPAIQIADATSGGSVKDRVKFDGLNGGCITFDLGPSLQIGSLSFKNFEEYTLTAHADRLVQTSEIGRSEFEISIDGGAAEGDNSNALMSDTLDFSRLTSGIVISSPTLIQKFGGATGVRIYQGFDNIFGAYGSTNFFFKNFLSTSSDRVGMMCLIYGNFHPAVFFLALNAPNSAMLGQCGNRKQVRAHPRLALLQISD